MKSKSVKLIEVNQAQAIELHLMTWGKFETLEEMHKEVVALTKAGTFPACSVRHLQFPFKGKTLVALLVCYTSEETKGNDRRHHGELVYAQCETPLQIQAATQRLQRIAEKFKETLPLPAEAVLNQGQN